MQADAVAVQVGDVGKKAIPGGSAVRGSAMAPPWAWTRANAASITDCP